MKRKIVFWITALLLTISFLLALGVVGGIEMDKMGFWEAILWLSVSASVGVPCICIINNILQ